MRRLSTFLMTAALLAVLVPSAALAAPPTKPLPAITGLTWTAVSVNPDSCITQLTVHYTLAKGALPQVNTGLVRYTADGSIEYFGTDQVRAASTGQTTVTLFAPYEPQRPVAAFAFLSDRKGTKIGDTVETMTHTFTNPCSMGPLPPVGS